jgi:tRNA pseudouridine55 synthase
VRQRLALRRVGHLGTLDPIAAGVLPVAVGRATRLLSALPRTDKEYRAFVVFGIATDTLDAEGQPVSSADASHLTATAVSRLLDPLRGELQQVPPAYSAVHVGGRRLYDLARRGLPAAASARPVQVTRLDLVEFVPGQRATALLDVTCSAGTYLRALAADLGRAAGCGAHLGFLLRTRSGPFGIEDSATLEEFASGPAGGSLLSPDWPLQDLPRADLDPLAAHAFAGGSPVRGELPPSVRVRVYVRGRFLGLGEASPAGLLQPRLVFAVPEEVAECG